MLTGHLRPRDSLGHQTTTTMAASPAPSMCCEVLRSGAGQTPARSKASFALPSAVFCALMGSSCCILQLALSYASLGCLGFSFLKPLQPYARALTVLLLGQAIYKQGRVTRQTGLTIVVCSVILMSQELVAAYNRGGVLAPLLTIIKPLPQQQPPVKRAAGSLPLSNASRSSSNVSEQSRSVCSGGGHSKSYTSSSGSSSSSSISESQTQLQYYRFRMEGVKCEACAQRIKVRLLAMPGLDRCVVDITAKSMLVWADLKYVSEPGIRAAVRGLSEAYKVQLVDTYAML